MVVCSSVLTAAQRGAGQAPTGTSKDAISMVQQNSTKVSLQAQKAAWRAERGALRAKSKMAVPAQGLAVVTEPVSIEAPFSSRDLPGGTLFIVKLEKDKNGLAFQGDATGNPEKNVIVVKTSDLKFVEKDGVVVYTLDQSRKLKSGQYAVVMLDNQYMWPFEIR
jgi:hypothetical protein